MSTTLTNRRVSYPGGSTSPDYAVPFHFAFDADLKVSLFYPDLVASDRTVTVNPNTYIVSGAGAAGGGVITLVGWTVAADAFLVIERILEPTQPSSLVHLGDAYPRVVEAALDRLAELHQQVEDIVGAADPGSCRVPKLAHNETDGGTNSAYDFRSNRGKNCVDPIDDQDVATRAYVSRAVAGVTGGGAAGSWISGTVTLLSDLPTAAVEYEDQIWKIADPVAPRMFKVCMRQSDGTSFAWETLVAAGT